MKKDKFDIVIIGGGASGLMCAAALDVRGSECMLVEAGPEFGRKLLITGGGRCNITHAGNIKDFTDRYSSRGADPKTAKGRVRKWLYRHSNEELRRFFEERGLKIVIEDERMYPESMNARDVRDLLVSESAKNGWKMCTDSRVMGISATADGGYSLLIGGEEVPVRNVVIATGGKTFPETGSDGAFHAVLEEGLGVETVPMQPVLAPIYVKDYPYAELSGMSEEAVVSLYRCDERSRTGKPDITGKAVVTERGNLLFTHRGFSGPAVINASMFAEPGMVMCIEHSPDGEMPRRLAKLLEERAGLSSKLFDRLVKDDRFIVQSVDERGIVSAGGIGLLSADAGTLELAGRPGCFACGEALDAAGMTGGYNLQLCYSTANIVADALRSKLAAE